MCTTLAARGYDLVILYRSSEEPARALAQQIAATGRGARARAVDVGIEAQVAEVFAEIARQEGRVDLLVNNVGNYNPQPITNLTPAVWDATLATNLSGAYYCCFHALSLMPAGGNIINIGMAGLEGIRANVRGADYYVSKTGLLSLTRSLAVAYAGAADPRQHGVARSARQLGRPAAAGSDRADGAARAGWRAARCFASGGVSARCPVCHRGQYRRRWRLPAVAPMTSASALVPLWNRGAEWERRLAMVREARSFLYLSTFYIEHDPYGLGMLAELIAAQRRGVAVNLLIDGFGQRLGGVLMSGEHRATLAALLDDLRHAGGVVTTYNPERRMQRWLGGGQHVKIQVSEAGEAIFGSSNLSRSSFDGWNEYAVALRGRVVPVLLESYRDIGGEVDASHLRHLEDVAESAASDVMLDYWVCNPNRFQGMAGPLGWRGRNEVTASLIDRIAAAKSSIWITSFYFKPVRVAAHGTG